MKIEIVAKTKGIGKYEKLSSEEIIAAIARHGTIKEDNGKLVKHLMDNKHWSPLDMINFTFEIETSRSIGRQLLRHSSIRPQEHSQRYSNRVIFENIEIRKEHPTNRQSSTDVFDPEIEKYKGRFPDDFFGYTPKVSDALEHHLERVQDFYFDMLELGVAKECARDILPGCTRTTMTMNGTLRSWLSFLNVRLDHHAQKECQIIAQFIGETLAAEMPKVFAAIDWENGMFM